jgi:hypothetical protein
MVANYLERIALAGSRRGAAAQPAVSGPPLMPVLARPPPRPRANSFPSPFGEMERNDTNIPAARSTSVGPVVNQDAATGRRPAPAVQPEASDPLLAGASSPIVAPHYYMPSTSRADVGRVSSILGVAGAPLIRLPSGLRRKPGAPPGTPSLSEFPPPVTAPVPEQSRPATGAAISEDPLASPETSTAAYIGPYDTLVGQADPVPRRAEAAAKMRQLPPHATAVATPQTQTSGQLRARATVQDAKTGDPTPATSGVRVPDMRAGPSVPPSPGPPILARPRTENRIAIGRVEVQVNNLSPQVPVASASKSVSASHSAGAFLPGSYYLDRFSLRP